MTQCFQTQAIGHTHPGNFVVMHRNKNILRMQNFVVLEVVQQCGWYRTYLGCHEYRRSLNPLGWADKNGV